MGVDVYERGRRGGVRGTEALIKKLNFLSAYDSLNHIAHVATYGTAKDLRELARDNARRNLYQDSGALLRAFAIKKIKKGTKLGYAVGMRFGRKRTKAQKKAGDDAYYWWMLEFGTKHIPPKHFFTDAFKHMAAIAPEQIINYGHGAVQKAAERAVKRHGEGGK